MAAKSKEKPYQEFAHRIASWRAERYRSALALFKEAKFSFSYRVYADIESGAALPSLDALLELTRFFGKDETSAVLQWVRVQVDSAELREQFTKLANQAEAKKKPETVLPSQPQPSFENTWIFGLAERKALLEAPWLSDVFAALLTAYPNEVRFESFALPPGVSDGEIISKYLSFAIQGGYILSSASGLRLRNPYIHLPRTEEWSEVRSNNIRRALESVMKGITEDRIDAGLAHRELTVRKLSRSQAMAFTGELKALEEKLDSGLSSGEVTELESATYALIQVFGQRG